MTFFETVRKAMLAGLGVQEKVNAFVDELVQRGELSDSQGARLVREWSEKARKSSEDFNRSANELVASIVGRMNLASKDELDKLSRKVQALTSRVKKLEAAAAEKTDASP